MFCKQQAPFILAALRGPDFSIDMEPSTRWTCTAIISLHLPGAWSFLICLDLRLSHGKPSKETSLSDAVLEANFLSLYEAVLG